MAASVLVDAGFLVAFLNRRDRHGEWAIAMARRMPPPWKTCEAVLSEGFHLLERNGAFALRELIRRGSVLVAFDLGDNLEAVLKLLEKYEDVPAGLADACLVRMSELVDDPVVLTTDSDFRVYRRHGRQVVPCLMP